MAGKKINRHRSGEKDCRKNCGQALRRWRRRRPRQRQSSKGPRNSAS